MRYFLNLGGLLEIDLYYRSMSGKDEVRVKMLIIGESYVGKSSLLTQYVDE